MNIKNLCVLTHTTERTSKLEEEAHARLIKGQGRAPRTNRKTDVTNEKQVEDLNRVFTKEATSKWPRKRGSHL